LLPLSIEAVENNLIITISNDGDTKIIHNLNPQATVSTVTLNLITDDLSNILAVDENGIILDTIQTGNSIRIATLGANSVQLSYDSKITIQDSGIWKVKYSSTEDSTIVLPPLANIVSVNNIPLDMNNDSLVMPPGDISLSYTIRDVEPQDFQIISDGLSYTVQIMTGSEIDSFKHESGIISFNVSNDFPVLAIIPNSLSSGTFEIFLNDQLIDHQNYFQDGTSSWIRFEPQSSGMVKIIDHSIPKENSQSSEGGGCLIATAAYGSELAPQVQFLREIRDNTVMSTSSGAAFMSGFNTLYYSFSPQIADLERNNPMFQETVRAFITPMVSTLSIMTLAEDGNDTEVFGLGISVIALNLGMYIAAPAAVGFTIHRQIKSRK